MFAVIGMIIVSASVIGGYLMQGGNLSLLVHPAKFILIFGSAFGAFFIASSPKLASLVFKGIGKVFAAKSNGKAEYLDVLSLLYQIFSKIRKEGLIAVESDIENPQKSPIFSKYKSVLPNHHALNYICDNLKVIISTNISPHELDNVMEIEIEALHQEAIEPSHAIAKVADALPGLGIVAAVLGIVLTMENIDAPPAVLGYSIGAALVGTFIGILACYGFVGPMATNLENLTKEELPYFHVIRVALVAFVGGAAPQIAVEFGRRAIPSKEKPSFDKLEEAIRQ